jgi:hypothetical protein
MRILSKEEATKVERPEGMAPWTWPEPAFVAVSDCFRVLGVAGARSAEDHESPLSLALAVNFFESLYEQGYAIVKLDEEPVEAAVDLRPWFVTITAVRPMPGSKYDSTGFIPAIKALRLVGTDELGWRLSLADAKAAVDAIRHGTPFVFTVADEVAAKDAKAQLESAGMTIRVSQETSA